MRARVLISEWRCCSPLRSSPWRAAASRRGREPTRCVSRLRGPTRWSSAARRAPPISSSGVCAAASARACRRGGTAVRGPTDGSPPTGRSRSSSSAGRPARGRWWSGAPRTRPCSRSVRFVGVGDIYVIAGQSNASGRGIADSRSSHETLRAGLFGNDDRWRELRDPVDSAGEAGRPGEPGLVRARLRVAARGHRPHGRPSRCRWRSCPARRARRASTSGCPIPSARSRARRCTAPWCGGRGPWAGVRAVLFWQGEADARALVPQADYEEALRTLADERGRRSGGAARGGADRRLRRALHGRGRERHPPRPAGRVGPGRRRRRPRALRHRPARSRALHAAVRARGGRAALDGGRPGRCRAPRRARRAASAGGRLRRVADGRPHVRRGRRGAASRPRGRAHAADRRRRPGRVSVRRRDRPGQRVGLPVLAGRRSRWWSPWAAAATPPGESVPVEGSDWALPGAAVRGRRRRRREARRRAPRRGHPAVAVASASPVSPR